MISIVIPNYNGQKYLKECLESIYVQDYILENNEYEIIIVDNGSSDGDYSWVELYQNIVFIKLDQNYGFSKAVNEGIGRANGEYVLLLNNDTKLCDGFLKEIEKAIFANDNIFAVSSKMLRYNQPELIDDAGDDYNILGWAYKRGDGKSEKTFNKQERVFSACAGAALYRKKIFKEIGLFDEGFFAYMEDIDVSYRANIYGYKNIYEPKAKVYHIGSATSGSKYNSFKVRLAAKNNVYVAYKNMPILQLILNFPFLFLGFIIKWVWFRKIGFGKEYKEGFCEALRNLKQVEKTSFNIKNTFRYFYIEWMLLKNLFRYIISKCLN